MDWKKSATCGASNSANIHACFFNEAERLIHGAQIDNHPNHFNHWYKRAGDKDT
jgi:hypothetical protein